MLPASPASDAPSEGQLLSQLLSALEAEGVVVLQWRLSRAGDAQLPCTLILPPPATSEGGRAASSPWFGASLVRLVSSRGVGGAGGPESAGTRTLVLAPACLKLFPFALPRLPVKAAHSTLPAQGRSVARAVSGCGMRGGGGGEGGSAVVLDADAVAGGGGGVALLCGEPPDFVLEAVSGVFPLFADTTEAEAPPLVLPLDWCTVAERAALAYDHWLRLQPFLPANLATRLTAGGGVDEALKGCVWCTVRYPGGDPFPCVDAAAESVTAVPVPRTHRGHDRRQRQQPARLREPPRPYYLLPDFLLMRYATPCVGQRSIEPRLRHEASAAAAMVQALVEDHSARHTPHFFDVHVEDVPVTSRVASVSLQAASNLQT